MNCEERRNGTPDTQFRAVGIGSLVTRSCMGCQRPRLTTGSTGSGLRWRCAECSKGKK